MKREEEPEIRPKAKAEWMAKRSGSVVRVGHRGVGVRFAPPNTLRAYRRALEFGVEMIEVDLHQTKDGALVLAHDDEIHAEGGPPLSIADHTLEALRRIDLGEGEVIPTLAETIDLCRDRCAIMIDLKGEGFEEELVALLHRSGFTNVVIPGGGERSRKRIRSLDPTLPIALSFGHEWKERLDRLMFDTIDTDSVSWHYSLLDEPVVSRLHAHDLHVFAWTVNNAEEMARLVAIGVDGIISDRVDFLRELNSGPAVS